RPRRARPPGAAEAGAPRRAGQRALREARGGEEEARAASRIGEGQCEGEGQAPRGEGDPHRAEAAHGAEEAVEVAIRFPPPGGTDMRLLLGNEALALGAMDGGARFYAGHPLQASAEIDRALLS